MLLNSIGLSELDRAQGRDLGHLPELREGGVVLPLLRVEPAELCARLDEGRVDGDRPPEVALRLGEILPLHLDAGQDRLGLLAARIGRERLLGVASRRVEVSLLQEGAREVGADHRPGLAAGRQRLLEAGDGGVGVPFVQSDHPAVVVRRQAILADVP